MPDAFAWLRLPSAANPKLPSIFLVGDSTVRTGRGDGERGQWGWGEYFPKYLDLDKVNVVNRAVGGTGIRSFRDIGHWAFVEKKLKPGDIVLIQFGHNDNGPKAPLKGTGEETEEREDPTTKEKTPMHSWGWYLRCYISEIRAKGATPVICSLIPRNMWKDDKVVRTSNAHADWARVVAQAEGVAFVDLYEIIASRYDELGREKVKAFFADGSTHTSAAGAELNAQCVIAGLKALPKNPVEAFLRSGAGEAASSFKFDFGPGATAAGYTQVKADTVYSAERGYGFEPGAVLKDVDRGGDPLRGDFVTGEGLFKFSVAVPEGNYRVSVTLGDMNEAAVATVKAETRRLMAETVETAAGLFETRTFVVNVRTPKLSPGNEIKLDVREVNPQTHEAVTATWDEKLTLQFTNKRPCVCAVEIERINDAITVFLIGDSTVTDQASEPYGSWGQNLPRWFKPPVVIANHAESGQTLKAFRFQRRWDKVMSQLKPGDYVFMQFGHNDLNKTGHDAMWAREDAAGDWINTHADANTDYKWLLAAYAVEVKRRGATPVIISPMTKINIRSGQPNIAGLGDYPKAAAEAATLSGAAYIDLNGMSIELMKALGEKLAPKAYVDGLHSNSYGAYLFSRCIVEGIRAAHLDLVRYLTEDAGTFELSHPLPLPEDYKIPVEAPVPVPVPPGFIAPKTKP